jgi:multidrug efflux pump subunit AcrB
MGRPTSRLEPASGGWNREAARCASPSSALFSIAKAEDPTFPYPNFTVVAVYPGSSPADIEKLIVDPIEAKLKALDDVKTMKTMKTEISDGLAVITIEFAAGTDADKKYDDVLRELNVLRAALPTDLQTLKVDKFNAADVNILQVSLVSATASYRELAERADRLRKRLENRKGVKEAKRWAFPGQEVRVSLDLERLAALGVTPLQVIGAIQATNVNIPAGSVDVGRRKFNVKTSGDYSSLGQVEDTVVASVRGDLVHLRDVAEVAVQDEDANYLGRFNGQREVFVTANMKERQNIFQVRDALWAELDGFEKELPPGMRLERGFDQSRNVAHRLEGFTRDFGTTRRSPW